jgi:HlyD family secretion protein
MRRAVAVCALVAASCGKSAPEVPFTRVARGTLVSTLVTNAKVEPLVWREIRAPRAGQVAAVAVEAGAAVRAGQTIATLEDGEARAAAVAAQAKLDQANAELARIEHGPSAQAVAAIEGELAQARLEHEAAGRRVRNFERLVASNAATGSELTQARERLAAAEASLRAVEKRKAALTVREGREAALARVREAQSALDLARGNLAASAVASPVEGVVYGLAVRPGSFVQAGDLIARVGRTAELRAVIYVDEPELGRVAAGMPVEITWDALPERKWTGAVEKMPSQIVALGSRQVGEVLARIGNADGALPPGANVNASIRSKAVENTMTAPKEAVRREGTETFVFVLEGDKVRRRAVRTGASSVTHVELLGGAKEGDAVALPSPATLKDGDAVRPVFTP